MKNGYMIALEGTDKAGKHTQVMNIIKYLQSRGIAAETLDFPQYNAYFGRMIRDYLNGKFGTVRDLPARIHNVAIRTGQITTPTTNIRMVA